MKVVGDQTEVLKYQNERGSYVFIVGHQGSESPASSFQVSSIKKKVEHVRMNVELLLLQDIEMSFI